MYRNLVQPPVDDLLEIDRLADEFESAWQSGSKPSISDFLKRIPAEKRSTGLNELILVDIDYRRHRGEQPVFAEYQREFPDYFDLPVMEEKPNSQPFEKIGRYVVLSKLPPSGQAEILLAIHPLSMQQVVLKFFRRDLPKQLESVIAEEAYTLIQLRHPRIAPLVDLDYHEGRPFAAIAYVHGQTLDQYAQQHKLSHPEIARLMASLARTLAAAHRVGIAHLDLKPRNVIVDSHGEPHLIDFGAARLFNSLRDDSRSGEYLVGTAAFMSPEQANQQMEKVGIRSDVFGLGALLYFLLSQRAPFAAETASKAIQMATKNNYAPLSTAIPRRLRHICTQAMHSDPAQRHASAESFADELQAFITPSRSRKMILTALATLITVIAFVVGWHMLATLRPSDPMLSVTYYQEGGYEEHERWIPLENAAPHFLGTPLRLAAKIPTGNHAALFLLDTDGEISTLLTLDANTPDRLLSYPPDQAATITGMDGNRALICLTSAKSIPDVAALRALLADIQWPLPQLPDGTVVTATSNSVEVHYATRIRGIELVSDNSPDQLSRASLNNLRSAAAHQNFGFAAVMSAFRER